MPDDLPPRPPDDLARLERSPVSLVGRFGDASNATFLGHLGELDGTSDLPAVPAFEDLEPDRWVVYKPRRGEAPLWDFPDGSLHLREVAAFVVDRALGWGMVPPTVLRHDLEYGVGSVQLFIPHDPAEHLFSMMEAPPRSIERQVQRMVAFDAVIDNADRKAGHVLRGAGDLVWLVDHGVCFHHEPHLRTVAWHLAGEDLPAEDRDDVARLAACLGPGDDLDLRLRDLLSRPERAALLLRARRLADVGRYPAPSGPRPTPWPLV